jgi:O-methyltransferase domain/Dimerisation domain
MDIRRAITGYQVSQALHVAATLEIADALEAGPLAVDELARTVGANPDALYRLLRALARAGVFEERDNRVFALNEGGDALRRASGHAAFIGRPLHWDTWSHLIDAVRTGEPAFPALHGCSVWEYRVDHPEESAKFDAFMTDVTRAVEQAIVAGFDFGRFAHVVDVGGGRGTLLAAILAAYPETSGTLFDQEHVVAGVELPRGEVVSGSFFEAVPRGGDAYVLKSILHDWGDDEAVAILRVCAAALDGDARVLVVERDLADPAAPWLDLQMLVMLGGRERTDDEYAELYRAAGLEYVGATPVDGHGVFEARRPR